jgi:intracellular multiplication protein IcmE
MANRLAKLLGNTKTRTLVLLVLGILIFTVVLAVSQTDTTSETSSTQRVSKTTEVPNQVKSTPGADVTRNYQDLQQKANIRGAQEAAQKGTTFIPTIIGNAKGYNDKDFEAQLTSAYDNLGGKCSKEKIAELSKKGLNTTQIILELKSYGCNSAAIASLFTPEQIAAALLAETNCTLPGAAGAGGASGAAGAIGAAGSKQMCSPDYVKNLKAQGNDAIKIASTLKANGCVSNDIATSLKTNGYTAEEVAMALKANGVSATEVAAALTTAGFSRAEILPALTKAGFSPVEIAKALSSMSLASATSNAALLAQQQSQANAAQRAQAQQEAQQLAAFSQQRQGKIQDLVTAMESEKKNVMDVWTQVPPQAFQEGEWNSKKAQAAAADGGTSGSGRSGSRTKDGQDQAGKVILKAGSILFAVLDTAVDSDQPGPVMATIVSGSLKGSKLLGSMTANTTSESIALTFTAINMPNEANSMGFNAVAIDPDTARTALASDVDHHYMYRWGSLFASSFVQGYATAVASSGNTSTTSQGAAGTVTTTSTPALNPKQQLFAGISAVGTKWSQVVGQNFDRPITITIDQGTGIGVLVTSDVTYGTNPTYYAAPTTTAAVNRSGATNTTEAAPGGGTALTNEQRQSLLNLLQNQPAPTNTTSYSPTPGSTVVTTTGGGVTP